MKRRKYIKRYEPIIKGIPTEQCDDGQYVLFSEYLKERHSLEHSCDHLQKIVGEIAALVRRDQNKETLLQAVERVMQANGSDHVHAKRVT